MPNYPDPMQNREFRCEHCNGLIRIPADLPPTAGPCPHCGKGITSPPSLSKGPRIRGEDEEAAYQKEISENIRRSYLPVIAGTCAIIVVITMGVILALKENDKPVVIGRDDAIAESDAIRETQYIRTGWKKDAYEVLDGFLRKTTAREKMPYILRADSLAITIENFYGGNPINDSDTPAEAFSAYDLSEDDRRRGLFMMVFDQPPQFSMMEFFRPVATLEVQYGLTNPDLLLSSMAQATNFTTDPLRVHAFFRKTPEGLKIDWEIFVQTKYRQLIRFLELPEIGQHKVFRVFIMEDVQDDRSPSRNTRTYRISDPANTDHSARIEMPADSKVAHELSMIHWVGLENELPKARTATVELEWIDKDGQPHLTIRRLLCWEFLGLGGEYSTDTTEPDEKNR